MLVTPSSVVLDLDVDVRLLYRIMLANCLSLASPACATCKTKRDINHRLDMPVGRRVNHVDLIAPLIPGWEEDVSRRSFLGQIADSHNLEDTPMGVS